MRKENYEMIVYVVTMLSLAVLGIAIANVIKYSKCHSQFGRSGFSVEWGPIQGCMVEVRKGVWLPSTSIRDISLESNPPK